MHINISAIHPPPPLLNLALALAHLSCTCLYSLGLCLLISASQHCLGSTATSDLESRTTRLELPPVTPSPLQSPFLANILCYTAQPSASHTLTLTTKLSPTPTKRSLKMESHMQLKTPRKLRPWRGKRLLSGRWFVSESFIWLHQTAKLLACVPRCAEHSRGTQQLSRGGGEEAANEKTEPSSCTKSKAGTQPCFQHILCTSLKSTTSLGRHWVEKLSSW